MNTIIEGKLIATGLKTALVVSRFNSLICERLLEGALDCLVRHGADLQAQTIVRVPGSFEIPLICKRLALAQKYDAIIALGAVIRGGTPHFEYIAAEVTKGIAHIALDTGIPIAFGILTTDTLEQAIERAGSKMGNKGAEAAIAAIEMVDIIHQIPLETTLK
jgi:6,7-dimethyl-8-ribityllumazine synthase